MVVFFNKSKKKKTNVNYEEWQDKLSQSINLYMTAQAQDGKEFFQKLFGEKSSVEFGDDNTIVIKVLDSGKPFSLR